MKIEFWSKHFLPYSPDPDIGALNPERIQTFIGDPTPVLINCTFENLPDVDLTISHNGQVIKKGKSPLYMKINVTKKEDFGLYMCSVEDVGDRPRRRAFILSNAGRFLRTTPLLRLISILRLASLSTSRCPLLLVFVCCCFSL